MSEPDFHLIFQTSKDKTSSFDIDPECFEGCRNGCEPILIVSSGWSIISLSLSTVGEATTPVEEVKRWDSLQCCACLAFLRSAVPTCDKSGFGPPPPFAPGPPLYSSSGKAGALCNQHTEKKTHNKLSPADFDTPQIILQVRLAITQISCPCSWCAPPFRGMPG